MVESISFFKSNVQCVLYWLYNTFQIVLFAKANASFIHWYLYWQDREQEGSSCSSWSVSSHCSISSYNEYILFHSIEFFRVQMDEKLWTNPSCLPYSLSNDIGRYSSILLLNTLETIDQEQCTSLLAAYQDMLMYFSIIHLN